MAVKSTGRTAPHGGAAGPADTARDDRPAGARNRAARRPGTHPARPHRRADRPRLRRQRRGDLRRRLLARRRATRRPGCASCRRWTAPWCSSSDGSRILRANVQLVPDPSIPTEESGTRHRSAERTAIQTGYPVISVSHSMSIVTVYVAGERHVVPDSATILSRANQTIDTLERYKTRLDEVSRQLSTAEIEDFVTLRDVMTVVQRLEMVRRISLEIDADVVELGTDGRQLKLQLEELVGDNDTARELIVRDYHANPDPPTAAQVTRDARGARRALRQRTARLHHAGKGFRLSVDGRGAGFGDELAGLPGDGRHSPAAVRARRPAACATSARCRACWPRAPATCSRWRASGRCGPATSARVCRSWPSRRSPTGSPDLAGCRSSQVGWRP